MVPALCGIEVERAALNPWLVAQGSKGDGDEGEHDHGEGARPQGSPRPQGTSSISRSIQGCVFLDNESGH